MRGTPLFVLFAKELSNVNSLSPIDGILVSQQGRGTVPRKKAQLKPVAMAPVYPITVLRNKPADVFAGVRGKIVSHDKMYKKSFEDRPTANRA